MYRCKRNAWLVSDCRGEGVFYLDLLHVNYSLSEVCGNRSVGFGIYFRFWNICIHIMSHLVDKT